MNHKLIIILIVLAGVLLAPFSAAPAAAQQSSVCTTTHIVQRGETLFRIARRYNTTVAFIAGINSISNPNVIYAGQSLCVATTATQPQPQPGGTTYVVQAGDTLSMIARRFGVNMTVLAQVNGIVNPNRIYVGQVLRIPEVTIQ